MVVLEHDAHEMPKGIDHQRSGSFNCQGGLNPSHAAGVGDSGVRCVGCFSADRELDQPLPDANKLQVVGRHRLHRVFELMEHLVTHSNDPLSSVNRR